MRGRILVSALLFGACLASPQVEVVSLSDSDGGSAPAGSPAPGVAPVVDPVFDDSAPISLVAQRQFGNGRAVAATPFGRDAVVATTSATFRLGTDGAIERIWSELDGDVRDVRASDDGRFVALLGRSARAEVFDMSNGAVRTAVLDDVWDIDFLADATVVASNFSDVRMLTAADGVVRAELAAPDGRTISHVESGGNVVHVLLESDGPDELLTWDGGEAGAPKPLDIPDGLSAERITADPDSNRIGIGVVDPFDGSRASIGVFDGSSAELLYAIDAGVEAAAPSWVLLPGGGLFAAREASFDILDPDGAIISSGDASGVIDNVVPLVDGSGGVAVALESGDVATVGPDGTVSELDREGDRVMYVGANPHGTVVVDAAGRVDRLAPDGSLDTVNDAFMGGVINDVAVSASAKSRRHHRMGWSRCSVT